jgi:hypothetical protein
VRSRPISRSLAVRPQHAADTAHCTNNPFSSPGTPLSRGGHFSNYFYCSQKHGVMERFVCWSYAPEVSCREVPPDRRYQAQKGRGEPNGIARQGPPLWSSGQSSGLDSRHYQIFCEVVGLQRGPLSLVSTTEELLERKK